MRILNKRITFDGALEQLWEDAVGGQLMEDAAQELLGHPCCIARNHHAAFEQREDTNHGTTSMCLGVCLEFRHLHTSLLR